MSNALDLKFARKQAGKAKPETKEMSTSQRMTLARGGSIGASEEAEAKSPWQRHNERLELQKPAPTVIPDAAPKTQGGLREDPTLTAAREAEQARRRKAAKSKADAAFPQYQIPSEQDILGIFKYFVDNHRDFVMTEFNGQQLIRMMQHNCASGKCWWNYAGFEACHKVCLEDGYYETLNPKRGQPAPLEIPEYRSEDYDCPQRTKE